MGLPPSVVYHIHNLPLIFKSHKVFSPVSFAEKKTFWPFLIQIKFQTDSRRLSHSKPPTTLYLVRIICCADSSLATFLTMFFLVYIIRVNKWHEVGRLSLQFQPALWLFYFCSNRDQTLATKSRHWWLLRAGIQLVHTWPPASHLRWRNWYSFLPVKVSLKPLEKIVEV